MIHKLPLGDRLLRIGVVLGMLCSAYLLYLSLSVDSIAGCGSKACDDLLASRWAKVFFIPVSLLGFALFAVWSVCEWRGKKQLRGWFAGLLVGPVIWFVLIQCLVARQVCPGCLVFHGIALFTALCAVRIQPASGVKAFGASLISLLFLGLAQVYGPEPLTHVIQKLPGKPSVETPDDKERTIWEKTELGLSAKLHPVLGDVESGRFIVMLFDYQCLECRRVANYLDDAMQDYPNQFAVILLPTPLEKGCTDRFPKGVKSQRGSCMISKSALAVWRSNPEKFGEFHESLIQNPDAELAEEFAVEIMGRGAFESAMRELAKERPFARNIDLRDEFSTGKTVRLPKIWLNEQTLLHGAPSSGRYFMEVMKLLLQLK